MNRVQLETLSIVELRTMALEAGIKTQKKAGIIAAMADDYRTGHGSNGTSNGVGPTVVVAAPQPVAPVSQPDDEERVIWPDVPVAVSEVNGEYVEPPWAKELEAAVQVGHVELMGPAGSGKTLAVHHLAAKQGRKLAVITADGGLRKRDLVGKDQLIRSSSAFLAAEFASAARNGDWALIDEANMAEADALGFLNGMLDRPGTTGSTFSVNGKAIEVHPSFRCCMTRNPGYHGTKSMNEALRDRFWSIEVPPLLGEALDAMMLAHGVDKTYIADARVMIETLYQAWERNRISYQISPRRALSAAAMASLTGESFREVLTRSILTKIDAKHDREAVESVITTTWRAADFSS